MLDIRLAIALLEEQWSSLSRDTRGHTKPDAGVARNTVDTHSITEG